MVNSTIQIIHLKTYEIATNYKHEASMSSCVIKMTSVGINWCISTLKDLGSISKFDMIKEIASHYACQ